MKKTSDVEIQTKSNIFCLDNESFRFLVANHQGIKFPEDSQKEFSISWNTSVQTTAKIMGYIKDLREHTVLDTVSLSDARKMIAELTKPLAEVARTIQLNIKLTEDKEKEISVTNKSVEDLEKILYLEQIQFKTEKLPHPRTVCTSASCIEIIQYNGIEKQNYKTHCHFECGLDGVHTDQINNPNLQKCAAMVNGKCKVCGCSWNSHMHVGYEFVQEKVKVKETNASNQLENRLSLVEKLENFKRVLIERKKKLKDEEKAVTQICAKFAWFTKKNAIVAFNDDIEKYLNLCIEEEENKQNFSNQNSEVLKNLKATRDNYNEEKRLFENVINHADSNESLTTADIKKLEEELFNMDLNGAQLQQVILEIRDGKKQVIGAYENHYIVKENKAVKGFWSRMKKFWSK